MKLANFLNQVDSDYYNFGLLICFVCRTKKVLEFPVERDFPNEKAFKAAQYAFLFQIFLRIRFFAIEVRFFGTAILNCRGYSLFYSSWM